MDTADRVRELLEVALGKSFDAGANVQREQEEAWDSVKHVELIFLLEDEFDMEFDEETMAQLNSVDSIVAAIERTGA